MMCGKQQTYSINHKGSAGSMESGRVIEIFQWSINNHNNYRVCSGLRDQNLRIICCACPWAKNWSAADKTNLKKKFFSLLDVKNINTFFFLRTYISYNFFLNTKIRRICECCEKRVITGCFNLNHSLGCLPYSI